MTATFTWHIEEADRSTVSDETTFFVRWRCEGSETQGEGDAAVTHRIKCVSTTSFTPSPNSPDYIEFNDLTEDEILNWVWSINSVSKENIQTELQKQLTEEFI